jgi:hypothetical protein
MNDQRRTTNDCFLEKTMKASRSKTILALVLAITVAATGSAHWINIALQDLPILTQMALDIAALVGTLAAGQQASAADTAVIQNISAQASRDLTLLQNLYSDYKANPSRTTLQKIQNVISDLNQNLPALRSKFQTGPLANAGMRVVADTTVLAGEDHVHWRIWQVDKQPEEKSALP